MLGLLSWKVIFECWSTEETECNVAAAPELSTITKESIPKKVLHVERSALKLLRTGLHHFCSDKDQLEAWYHELFRVRNVDDPMTLKYTQAHTKALQFGLRRVLTLEMFRFCARVAYLQPFIELIGKDQKTCVFCSLM